MKMWTVNGRTFVRPLVVFPTCQERDHLLSRGLRLVWLPSAKRQFELPVSYEVVGFLVAFESADGFSEGYPFGVVYVVRFERWLEADGADFHFSLILCWETSCGIERVNLTEQNGHSIRSNLV